MNGIAGSRSSKRLLGALLVLAGVALPLLARAATGGSARSNAPAQRPIPYDVLKKYQDGPWLVPTLESVRSESDWDSKMTRWFAQEKVAGIQPAPAVDWQHKAVVIVALGRQACHCGVNVNECLVEADSTVLDLHFDTGGDQWDPLEGDLHPAVLVAIDRSDLKNLKLHCDATVDGLPGTAGRKSRDLRPGNSKGAAETMQVATTATSTETAAVPTASSANASLGDASARTTWGRLKVTYR